MKNFLKFIVCGLLCAVSCTLSAQTNVDIGTGTGSTDNSPIQRQYDYSASELLYLNTEINYNGSITGLGFYKASGSTTVTIDSVYIYLKSTTATAITTTSSTNGYTLVYKGAMPNNVASGWVTVNFNQVTGYSYNSATNGNLSVLTVRPYQALTTSRPFYRYTDNVGAKNGWYRNNTVGWSGTMNEVSNWRPNLRLIFANQCSGTPVAGNTVAALSQVNCGGTTSLNLNGNTSALGIVYQWQYNTSGTWNNFGANTATVTTPVITTTTQFRCVVSCTNGNANSTSTPVTVNAIPLTVNLGNDTSICPGANFVLNASSTGIINYLWNTGATSSNITVGAAGTYSVLVSNGLCSGRDTIIVGSAPVPVAPFPDTFAICEGSVASLNAGNSGAQYIWNAGSTSQIITATSAGSYFVKITNTHGCSISDTIALVLNPLPQIDLGVDTMVCEHTSVLMDAGNYGASFLWSTGELTQSIVATQPGTYSVTVTDSLGCQQTDQKQIDIFAPATVDGFNFIPRFDIEQGRVEFEAINPVSVSGYLWDFGDGQTSVLPDPAHVYTNSGNYVVTLTVTNDCGSRDTSLLLHVNLHLGVEAYRNVATVFAVFPVPTAKELNIEWMDRNIIVDHIELFTIAGQLQPVPTHKSDRRYRLDLGGVESGNYILVLETSQGRLYRKVFVQK